MRKTAILFLAVTAGLIACDSPTDPNRVQGLNLPLNLSLIPSVGDSMLAAAQNCSDVVAENCTLNDFVAARCWV
jgi:hypothetical protein